ncbi:uncharacterized protein N7459_009580 [Penicillium hispanicum]|uniref:uncharacterized protein n=1 Tax=Penicillium hispanicum TaxID=1080232 RepID=UPI002540BAE1|nr:uncharacterized protein N7459_009580 [Penicillium hispanicum]KAJ5570150.1 hypothetical protein N7459_009580 [Penicillium hispanicum]
MVSEGGHKLIVGVDYGTTYTGKCSSTNLIFQLDTSQIGVTYVSMSHGQVSSINFIDYWPPGKGAFKTPSLVSYIQGTGPPLWGLEVQPGMKSYAWTKLLLNQDLEHQDFNDEILEKITGSGILKLPDGKEAVDAVADFLSQVYAHIPAKIELSHSHLVDLCDVPVDFWFTIPAGWSEGTQCLMRQAIKKAGFGSSSLHQVKSDANQGLYLMKFPHDGVLICDCGGGTVDIATYYVTDIDPRICFDQITTATGAKCGGTAVDSRFYQLLSNKLEGAFETLSPSDIGPGSSFMNFFETVKKEFDGEGERSWDLFLDLNVPRIDPTFFNRRRRSIILRSQDLRDLYDPILGKIFALILSQITAANNKFRRHVINKVVLVGGFSASPYLQNTLRRALKQVGNVSMLVPGNPPYEFESLERDLIMDILGEKLSLMAQHFKVFGDTLPQLTSAGDITVFHQGSSSCLSTKTTFRGLEICLAYHGGTGPSVGFYTRCVVSKIYMHVHYTRYPNGFQTSQRIQLHHWQHDLLVKPVGIYECDLPAAPEQLNDSAVRCIDYIQCHFAGLDLTQFPHQTIAGQTVYYLEIFIRVSLMVSDRMINFSAYTLGKVIGQKQLAMAYD